MRKTNVQKMLPRQIVPAAPKPRFGRSQVVDDNLAERTAQRRNALLRMGVTPTVGARGLDTTTGGEARAVKRQLRDARTTISIPEKPGALSGAIRAVDERERQGRRLRAGVHARRSGRHVPNRTPRY